MRAVEVSVSSDVQAVGYRRAATKIARKMNIRGYVKNQKDGTVKLVAEAEDKALERFLQAIVISKPPIIVESIEKKELKPTGKFRFFDIKPGSMIEELQEGLGSGEERISVLTEEFRDYRREFRSEFGDYRKEFGEFAQATGNNFKSLEDKYGEISSKLTQILETFEKESTKTRMELTKAVDNLSRLVDEYIRIQEQRK